MKTSLVCLLLLAAMVCAAPRTKQTREARLHQLAEKARISDDAGGEALGDFEIGEEAASKERANCPYIPCPGPYGEIGYLVYSCPPPCTVGYDHHTGCYCCTDYC